MGIPRVLESPRDLTAFLTQTLRECVPTRLGSSGRSQPTHWLRYLHRFQPL